MMKNLFIFIIIATILSSCSNDELDSTEFLKNTTWIDDMTSNTSIYTLAFDKDGRSVVMTTINAIDSKQDPVKANYIVLLNGEHIELFESGKEERTYYGFIDFTDPPVIVLNTIYGEMHIYVKQ
jgi:hypothetical protein